MPDCDPALSGAAIRRCEFQRHYACGVSSPPLLRLRLRFRLRRRLGPRLPRLPSPRPSPWRDSHIRSRDDTFCRYRTGTLRTVASTAPTTSPLRPFRQARPTASPAAAMTGKSGGVIFRACTYGFRQGQFRNLPLDKLLDTVEFTLLLLVHERNGPPRSAGPRRAADAMDIIFGIVRHVIIDDHADILDVDTACDDVRRYENPHFIILSSITCSRFS